MRILVLSNLYPPHFIGGYELGCRDIVEALRKRGHEVLVLTSMYGVGSPQSDALVHRTLETKIGKAAPKSSMHAIFDLLKLESVNQKRLSVACNSFKPDVVYAWNMYGISNTLILRAQELELPISIFVSDQWLSQWRHQSILKQWKLGASHSNVETRLKLLRFALGMTGLIPSQLQLDMSHAQFCSEFLRDSIIEDKERVAKALIIHWNVDTTRFRPDENRITGGKFIYSGQLIPDKGVHIALEAFCKAITCNQSLDATFTIAGGTTDKAYVAGLKEIPKRYGLEKKVKFIGKVARETLPEIYREHDILLFPSLWDEPFSIALLEGMASGLAVVGTMTGGTPEILQDGINGLTYPKESVDECAAQIERLLNSPELHRTISRNAVLTVREKFAFPRMIDLIEADLESAVKKVSL